MLNPITKINAVDALYGQETYNRCDGNGVVIWKDGHETTSEETAAIDDKYDELLAEYNTQEYARNRETEYPSIQDVTVALAEKAEGDSTMWDTITEERTAVKAKFPKP